MKKLLLLAALTACSSANAAIIDYSWNDSFSRAELSDSGQIVYEERFEGEAHLSFDTELRAMTAASFYSEIGSFEWTGAAPVTFEPFMTDSSSYVVGTTASISATDDTYLFMYWDIFRIPSIDADPMLYLDNANLAEGAMVGLNGYDYLLSGSLAKVPEPSTLALLGLGLLGFATKRRLA